jgi:hypothetical protein
MARPDGALPLRESQSVLNLGLGPQSEPWFERTFATSNDPRHGFATFNVAPEACTRGNTLGTRVF